MNIVLSIILLTCGLVLLAKGGDWFVDSSVAIAKALRIPTLVIGATIVSLGTTLPELLTSIISIYMGKSTGMVSDFNSIAIGNSVGSMLCNIGLILSLVAMVKPIQVKKDYIYKSLFFMLVTIIILLLINTKYGFAFYEGVILLLLFALYVALNIIEAIRSRKKAMLQPLDLSNPPKIGVYCVMKFIIGAIAIAFGAYLLVSNAQNICVRLGIPAQIIGITVVAIGTSLPELVTSIIALKRGERELGVGNIIGANVINGCLLLGLITTISGGIIVDIFTRKVASFFLLAIVAVLVLPTMVDKKIRRWQGAVCMGLYLFLVVTNVVFIMT